MADKKKQTKIAGAAAKVVRQPPPPPDSGTPTLFFPVLSPFKLNGSTVKPGQYVELTEAAAELYFDDELIGEGVSQPPQSSDQLQS